MKTSDSILNSTLQAGGIEVKLSLRKMTLRILFLYILFMLAGSAAYVYIWEDMSAYGLGHYIGEFWGRHALFAIFLVVFAYIFGLVGIVCALGDFTLWYKLRPFHDNDLYQAGRDDLHCTIIKRDFTSDGF